MDNSELKRRLDSLEGLASAFRVEADEALFHGYKIGTEDLPVEALEMGCARAMRECQFMPSVFELRNLCGVESIKGRAIKAWERVKASINGYATVDFDCKVINATIRSMGGWVALCDTEAGEAFDVWAAKKFQDTYCELWKCGISEEMAAPLKGLFDLGDRFPGQKPQIPHRIETGLKLENKVTGRIGHSSEVKKLASSLKGIE